MMERIVGPVKTGIVLAIVLLLGSGLATERAFAFEEYGIYKGWTTDATTVGNYTTASGIQCMFYLSAPGNVSSPVATYNKKSSNCTAVSDVTSTMIFLQQTGDQDDMVLWHKTNCSDMVHLFAVYSDKEYLGNDYNDTLGNASTELKCMTFCDQSYPEYKAFIFNYNAVSPATDTCSCKTVTRQYHMHMNLPVYNRTGWNYYERLC